jgi:hypothetical protein
MPHPTHTRTHTKIDSFISDFEWFTARPDYTLPSTGAPDYTDFGYNNITFPAPQGPLIARYRSQYNMRFGGIRKPRLGNSAALVMAQSKGWLMGQGADPAGKPDGSRNTNYSLPAFFDFYAAANNQYLEDGVQVSALRACVSVLLNPHPPTHTLFPPFLPPKKVFLE